ncbi:hypothetical protein BC829DRAFT_422354, partial [Chytridium lagenaria]
MFYHYREEKELRGGIKDKVPKSRRSSPSLTGLGSSTPTGRAWGIAAAGSAEEALEPMGVTMDDGVLYGEKQEQLEPLTGVGVVIITGRAHRGSGGVGERITINRGEAGKWELFLPNVVEGMVQGKTDLTSLFQQSRGAGTEGTKGTGGGAGARMDADVRRLRRSSTREVSKALNEMEDQVDVVAVATKCPLSFGVAVGAGAAMLAVISRIEGCWWEQE